MCASYANRNAVTTREQENEACEDIQRAPCRACTSGWPLVISMFFERPIAHPCGLPLQTPSHRRHRCRMSCPASRLYAVAAQYIFTFLSMNDFAAAARVDRQWLSFASSMSGRGLCI